LCVTELIKDALNINKETIRTILHEDLWKTKVCAKFVPHSLTNEQNQEEFGIAERSFMVLKMTQTSSIQLIQVMKNGVSNMIQKQKNKVLNGS